MGCRPNHENPASASGAALVKFKFHGDDLDVVPGAGEAYVGIRRVCEALGVNFAGQLVKLREDPAVGVEMISTPTEGGAQTTACINLRSLPLWLATIHPSKVKPEAREKLIAYRREAADVLADHFLGKRQQDLGHAAMREVGDLRALVEISRQESMLLRAKVELLDPTATGTIGEFRAGVIRGMLRDAGRLYCETMGIKKTQGEIKERDNELRGHLGFPQGIAQRWELLPVIQFGHALAKANEILGREKKRARTLPPSPPQLPLEHRQAG